MPTLHRNITVCRPGPARSQARGALRLRPALKALRPERAGPPRQEWNDGVKALSAYSPADISSPSHHSWFSVPALGERPFIGSSLPRRLAESRTSGPGNER